MDIKLQTLASLSTDGKGSYGIGASAVDRSDDLYTYLRITDIRDDGTLDFAGLKSVNDEDASQYLLKPNDIVFARTGASTGRNYFYDGTDGDFVYAGFLIKFSIDPNKVNPKYVKYYCLSDDYRGWIHSFNTGSTRGNINAQTLGKMPIPIPPRPQQDGIVSILSSIDDKIRKNTEINQNLYEQIQTIYCKYFDPVSHEVTGVLSDICKLSTDKVQISDLSESTYYSTENMQPNKAGAIDASSLPAVSQTTRCSKGDVLVSNIRPYFKKIVYVTEECGCSTDVLCFVPQPDYSAFLFGTLYMDRFFDYMVAGSKGTKMPRGDKQQIMKYPIVVPTAEAIIAFNSAVTPMLEQIAINNKENERLATMRDTLLPRLMSGELDVSEIEL